MAMDSDASDAARSPAGSPAIYFDGTSNRRRPVTLDFADRLEIRDGARVLAGWAYPDIRRADSPSRMLRVGCLSAAALARLEIRDAAVAATLVSRCASIDDNTPGRRGVATIIGWSLAAAVSIVAVVLFGVPLAAERLTPLVPDSFERRLGDVADSQVKAGVKAPACGYAPRQQAVGQLVTP